MEQALDTIRVSYKTKKFKFLLGDVEISRSVPSMECSITKSRNGMRWFESNLPPIILQ